jgi:hypothetical protein
MLSKVALSTNKTGQHVICYTIGTEMGKELDYLTKLYLVKAFNVRKIVLEN